METNLILTNEEGLHARPAGLLVKKASAFKSTIEISAKGTTKNAKSLMSILSLGLEKGDQITFKAQGEDAEAALSALTGLIQSNFQS